MKQTHRSKLSFALSSFVSWVAMALFVFGQETGIVPCVNDCTFDHFVLLINNVIEKAFEYLVLPIFVALLVYAGYLYITSGGDTGVHKKAKDILWTALKGLVLALCAWIIVKAIFLAFGYREGLRFLE